MSSLRDLFNMENHDRFDKLWSGIKSIATAIAVLAGAIWGVYNFSALGEKAKAELQLADLKYREAALNFDMEAVAKRIPQDKSPYIEIVVRIKNVGNRDVLMCFEDPDSKGKSNCDERVGDPCEQLPELRQPLPPIRIVPATVQSNQVVFDKRDEITASMSRDDCPQRPVTEMRVQAGQTELYTAAVKVSKARLYRVSFFSYLTEMERITESPSLSSRRLPSHGRPFWGTTTFVTVDDTR